MTASYPAAVKTYTDKTDFVDTVQAAHMNSVQEEVNAIEAELGVDPAGSSNTVVIRLNNIDTKFNNIDDFTLTFVFGDATNVITAPSLLAAEMPFAGTITGWSVISLDATSGNITFNIKKRTYAGGWSDIDGSEPALLSAATTNQDLALSTWTTAVSQFDWIGCEVTGVPTSVKIVAVSIRGVKTLI